MINIMANEHLITVERFKELARLHQSILTMEKYRHLFVSVKIYILFRLLVWRVSRLYKKMSKSLKI